MKVSLVAILAVIMIFSTLGFAQEAGSLVGGIDVGITSAMGGFRTDTLSAGTGFGIGAEVGYYLLGGLSIGPFVRYHRFGSDLQSTAGKVSYNFPEYGGTFRMNVSKVDVGRLFLTGSAGIFKANTHSWAPDLSTDKTFESSTMFSAGIGICSNPNSSTIYEFEVRYNMGNADQTTMEGTDEVTTNYKFDFIYVMMRLSFNSKGTKPPPRY